MGITEISYLLFVAAILMIYWTVGAKFQWWILLVGSLSFYFINAVPYTIIYMLISVLTVYVAGMKFLSQSITSKRRKSILIFALLINVGMLAVLKYTNLLLIIINIVFGTNIKEVHWISSLAISFYTLQLTAYLIDCYWGVEKMDRNPLKVLLYTSYFPLMISGPINRYRNLGNDLFRENRFNYDRVTDGVRRIAWGIAKKVVVADRMVFAVDYMFEKREVFTGFWVIIAAVLFIIELYFDFSGCMDIVIGVSACFGIKLEENFNAPFLSKTVQEVWQRWHITLGGFLRDYVMYPVLKSDTFVNLGKKCKKKLGKRGRKIPSYLAMLIVWFLVGTWHGSSLKYVVGESLWFFIVIFLGQFFEPEFERIRKFFRINKDNIFWKVFQVIRTIILFSIGNIFFKAPSLKMAIHMIQDIFKGTGVSAQLSDLYYSNIKGSIGGRVGLMGIAIIIMMQIVAEVKVYKGKSVQEIIKKLPFIIRWPGYIAFLFLIIVTGAFGKSTFIYFGF